MCRKEIEKWLVENGFLEFDAVILADGDFPRHHIPVSVLHNARYLVCCDAAAKTFLEHENQQEVTSSRPSGNPHLTPLSTSPIQRQLKINAVIGDGDSLPSELKQSLSNIYHHFEEQDYNDLTKATRFLVSELNDENTQLAALVSSSHPSPHVSSSHPSPHVSSSHLSPSVPAPLHTLRIAYLGATGKREDHTIGNISLLKFFAQAFGIEPVMFTDYGVFSLHFGNATIPTFPCQQVSIFNISCKRLESEGLRWQASPFSEWWMGTLNEALNDTLSIAADGYYLLYRVYEKKEEL